MTTKEITKGNILIAEFLEHKIWMVKYYEGDIQADRNEIAIKDYESFIERGFEYDIYARSFQSDWNLLMPVIDKIEKMKGTRIIIEMGGCCIYQFGKKITSNGGEKRIVNCYKCVIDFIKSVGKK